jgi:hypothetical protein
MKCNVCIAKKKRKHKHKMFKGQTKKVALAETFF